MPTSLQGRAEKAKSQAKSRCRNLYGMLNEERLTDCWRDIRQEAAYGVDEVSAPADEPDVDETIRHLVERRQRKRSRANRVRRHDSPTGDGTRRPGGIPAVADTRRPRAVTRLRTASDAPDVRRGRDGDRPPMGAVDAVETRTLTRPCGRDHGGVEAAMQGFCATIAQEWLSRMVAERLADRARRRGLTTGLNAGGRDTDGPGWPPVTGPPPGGRVSPSLAPVDRHDAVDRWCARVVTHHGRGEACRSRDAEDVVGALERPPEADRVDTRRGQRLGPCGRERSAEQTRVMPCSRHPQPRRPAWSGWDARGAGTRTGEGKPRSHAEPPARSAETP